jgi:LysM repeat protein
MARGILPGHMDESVNPEQRPAAVDARARARSEPEALTTAGACPFLIAAGGAWRMTVPDREHRCAAFSPATSLAVAKQARLCLTPNHLGCATYLASTAAREARLGSSPKVDRAGRWGLGRTIPIVEEVGGLRATVGALLADRRTWPTIPAALLATLLVALGLSGSWGQGTATARATPTPTPPPLRSPLPTERASQPTSSVVPPSTEPSTVPTQTPGPSVTPSATAAVAYTTYRVVSGDTLYVIAQRFHTTVKAIQRLNGLTTTTLHIGQVLKIPKT